MKKPNKVLAILVLFFALNAKNITAQEDTCRTKQATCINADIVFVADWSSSVFNQRAHIINAARSLAENFMLSNDGIKIGIVTFNDEGSIVIKCTGDQTHFKKATNFLALNEPYGGTDISLGLEMSDTLFAISEQERGRKPDHKFIILISDGETAKIDEAIITGRKLKKDNVFIYTIQIVEYTYIETAFDGSDVLRNIASDEGFYLKSTYESLYEVIKKLEFCN